MISGCFYHYIGAHKLFFGTDGLNAELAALDAGVKALYDYIGTGSLHFSLPFIAEASGVISILITTAYNDPENLKGVQGRYHGKIAKKLIFICLLNLQI